MQRILIICDDLKSTTTLQQSKQLRPCLIEIAEGNADALRRLRGLAFDLVLTSPKSTVKEDLALVDEMEAIRPGLKTIVLAPEATQEDVIAALRARVFACFSSPFNVEDVASMAARALQADEWRGCIEV